MATGVPNLRVSGWENYLMYRIDRYIRSQLFAAAIAAPALVVVEAKAQEVQVRIYDGDHHDYHDWNAHEDRAYRHSSLYTTEVTSYTASSTTRCSGIIGIIVTLIQTAINHTG